LSNVNKIPKNKVLQFKIKFCQIIADCFNHVKDFDEAENYYKNFYELLKETEDVTLFKYKSLAADKLGKIFWQKDNRKNSIKYLIEGFDLGLKMVPKNRTKVNQS
jgi:hypothetical protein